jgi:hypothetical protein
MFAVLKRIFLQVREIKNVLIRVLELVREKVYSAVKIGGSMVT